MILMIGLGVLHPQGQLNQTVGGVETQHSYLHLTMI